MASIDLSAIIQILPHAPLGALFNESRPARHALRGVSLGAVDPADLPGRLEAAKTGIAAIANDLAAKSNQVDASSIESAKQLVTQLAAAMQRVFDLAVSIHGDLDAAFDISKPTEVLNQATKAFEDLQSDTESHLKLLGDIHAQVVEIAAARLDPIDRDMEQMATDVANAIATVQGQIQSTAQAVETLKTSIAQESAAVNDLQDKVSSLDSAATASDVIFSILTLGIGNAINHGPLDPLHLHDSLNSARSALSTSQEQLAQSANILQGQQNSLSILQISLDQQGRIAQDLPSIRADLNAASSRCIMLEKQFATIKDAAASMILKTGALKNVAEVTQGSAVLKKDFATGILEIVDASLIDASIAQMARQIMAELRSGYVGGLPSELETLGTTITQKLSVLANMDSVKSIV